MPDGLLRYGAADAAVLLRRACAMRAPTPLSLRKGALSGARQLCFGQASRLQLPYHAAGVADGDDVFRNIFRHYAAGADDAVAADADPGQDADVAANPDIIADGYRAGGFYTPVAFGGGERVGGGVKAAVGPDENIVAEGYRRGV